MSSPTPDLRGAGPAYLAAAPGPDPPRAAGQHTAL